MRREFTLQLYDVHPHDCPACGDRIPYITLNSMTPEYDSGPGYCPCGHFAMFRDDKDGRGLMPTGEHGRTRR